MVLIRGDFEIRENITPRGDGNYDNDDDDYVHGYHHKREYNSERRRKRKNSFISISYDIK